MATVFVARATGALGFRRLVALKRAHPHVRDDPELAASLRLEAKLASKFRHPNVVAVIDVQETEGEIELVLDYVEGTTLTELLRGCEIEGNFPAMTRVVLDVAAGLHAAHSATGDEGEPLGIVHRDVTPSNVLVGIDGIARLSDFGIAHATEREGTHTATGVLKGKVGYMAPEYVERYQADAKSDQFSLAIVAWEALAGKKLFKGPTEIETLKRVAIAKVPTLASIDARLAPLDPVMMRALAKRPEERFATVADFAASLEETARAAGLVGTHAEVATLVGRVAHASLDERKKRIAEATPGKRIDTSVEPAPSSRDFVPTASVVVPRESVPAPPDAPSSTETLSRSIDVSPPRPGSPRSGARSVVVAGVTALALVAVVLVGVLATRGPATEVPDAAAKSVVVVVAAEAGPLALSSSSESLETIEISDEPNASSSSADAGKKHAKGAHPSHPALVPTKAPPNPYTPKK